MFQVSDDVVDVPRIQSMLYTAGAPWSKHCCIYKVNPRLRDINKDAYTPKVVSVGPFHHGSPSLQNAEREKRIFLKIFIDRSDTDLESLAHFVEALEPHVRDYYSENTLTKAKLVEIILVDAGFILELFIWSKREDWNSNERLSLNSSFLGDVIMNLLLLENQVPFSVLKRIFTFARPANIPESLLELTLDMFSDFNSQNIDSQTVADRGDPLHFNDLLRTLYLQPESDRPHWQRRNEKLLYSVTELHEAGVKLKTNERSLCLLDLKFLDGALEIPRLTVVEETEILFGNMIAFEQCHYPFESYITGYVFLLSCLIKANEDADFLIKMRIIVNHLDRSNNVTRLFCSLGKDTLLTSFSSAHNQLCRDLNNFCEDSKTRMATTLRRDYYLDLRRTYCRTPLQTLATLGSNFLLVLTVIQTVCSILQVV